jgi:hypothetical protein
MSIKYVYDKEYSELENIARALYGIAEELKNLGFGDASFSEEKRIGAIEGLALKINDGLSEVSSAIRETIPES